MLAGRLWLREEAQGHLKIKNQMRNLLLFQDFVCASGDSLSISNVFNLEVGDAINFIDDL